MDTKEKLENIVAASYGGKRHERGEFTLNLLGEIMRMEDPLLRAAIGFPFLRAILDHGQANIFVLDWPERILDFIENLPDDPKLRKAKKQFIAELAPLVERAQISEDLAITFPLSAVEVALEKGKAVEALGESTRDYKQKKEIIDRRVRRIKERMKIAAKG